MKKKYLICTPQLTELGGVASHYLGLFPYLREDAVFSTVGSRKGVSGLCFLPFDLICFIFKLVFFRPEIVLVNPSLQIRALKRDYLFIRISNAFGKRVVVFIHGWDKGLEQSISSKKDHFFYKYASANKFIVLSSDFKTILETWFVSANVSLATTKVSDVFFEASIFEKNSINQPPTRLLLVSRITKPKGIYIAIDAIHCLNKLGFDYHLTVVGEGPDLEQARKYACDKSMFGITFTGRLSGEELVSIMRSHDMYLFPSFHGEGMPTSVLEAMSLGLPVVTTANAGLKDFFVSSMGEIIEMNSVSSLVEGVIRISKRNLKEISLFNSQYAKLNFNSEIVANKLKQNLNE